MEETNKKINSNIGLIIIILILIIPTVLTFIIKPYTKNTTGSNYINKGTTSIYSSSTLNTAYLSISDVKVTHNSVSTICSGTITVKSTSPYEYHFVRVKGAFKNSSGKTVDTASTYAIGSEWLKPGESTKFKMYVDKDSSIKSCTVTIER